MPALNNDPAAAPASPIAAALRPAIPVLTAAVTAAALGGLTMVGALWFTVQVVAAVTTDACDFGVCLLAHWRPAPVRLVVARTSRGGKILRTATARYRSPSRAHADEHGLTVWR